MIYFDIITAMKKAEMNEYVFESETIVTRQSLYRLISQAFPKSDQINQYNDFVNATCAYWIGSGKERKKVEVQASEEEVKHRLDLICSCLRTLSKKDQKGKPSIPLHSAYDYYSVIATNWISIHGCLGTDGHARATIALMPITLQLAGYPHEYVPITIPNISGTFDMKKSKAALVYLNGHLNAGFRITASVIELDQTGTVSSLLRDGSVVYDVKKRIQADLFATRIIAERVGQRLLR